MYVSMGEANFLGFIYKLLFFHLSEARGTIVNIIFLLKEFSYISLPLKYILQS